MLKRWVYNKEHMLCDGIIYPSRKLSSKKGKREKKDSTFFLYIQMLVQMATN